MSKSMAILIGASIYIVGIILIILTIYLIEKQNKKKLDKELARLETLKNLIISSGILTEMEKVKSLINNEKLLSTYEKWEKRYKQIEKEILRGHLKNNVKEIKKWVESNHNFYT